MNHQNYAFLEVRRGLAIAKRRNPLCSTMPVNIAQIDISKSTDNSV